VGARRINEQVESTTATETEKIVKVFAENATFTQARIHADYRPFPDLLIIENDEAKVPTI
jgi:hypothetical protein